MNHGNLRARLPVIHESLECPSGERVGSIRNVTGTWMIGGEKGDEGQKFQRSMVELVPAEFAKLSEKSSIGPLLLEDLIK